MNLAGKVNMSTIKLQLAIYYRYYYGYYPLQTMVGDKDSS